MENYHVKIGYKPISNSATSVIPKSTIDTTLLHPGYSSMKLSSVQKIVSSRSSSKSTRKSSDKHHSKPRSKKYHKKHRKVGKRNQSERREMLSYPMHKISTRSKEVSKTNVCPSEFHQEIAKATDFSDLVRICLGMPKMDVLSRTRGHSDATDDNGSPVRLVTVMDI